MKYLNLDLPDLKREEFSSSSFSEIGVWLTLVAYCATIENGGVIQNCRSWSDRQWIASAGLVKDDVIGAGCDLWCMDDDDLEVKFYPVSQEAALKAKREAGKRGGRPKANPIQNKGKEPYGLQKDNHEVSTSDNVMECNGKERKVKKGNSNSKVSSSIELNYDKFPNISTDTKSALDEWVEYRKSIKKKLTQRSLDGLAKYSNQQIVKSIEASIMNGWTGVFPEKIKDSTKPLLSTPQHHSSSYVDPTKPAMS